jgi:hypothetical protein
MNPLPTLVFESEKNKRRRQTYLDHGDQGVKPSLEVLLFFVLFWVSLTLDTLVLLWCALLTVHQYTNDILRKSSSLLFFFIRLLPPLIRWFLRWCWCLISSLCDIITCCVWFKLLDFLFHSVLLCELYFKKMKNNIQDMHAKSKHNLRKHFHCWSNVTQLKLNN